MENGTSAKETIYALKDIFSIFGLPSELVSDNGPPFTSSVFITFLAEHVFDRFFTKNIWISQKLNSLNQYNLTSNESIFKGLTVVYKDVP